MPLRFAPPFPERAQAEVWTRPTHEGASARTTVKQPQQQQGTTAGGLIRLFGCLFVFCLVATFVFSPDNDMHRPSLIPHTHSLSRPVTPPLPRAHSRPLSPPALQPTPRSPTPTRCHSARLLSRLPPGRAPHPCTSSLSPCPPVLPPFLPSPRPPCDPVLPSDPAPTPSIGDGDGGGSNEVRQSFFGSEPSSSSFGSEPFSSSSGFEGCGGG
jgi:hypothetical protein